MSIFGMLASGGNPLLSPKALKVYGGIIAIVVILASGYFLYKSHVNLVAENARLEKVIEEKDEVIAFKDAQIKNIKAQSAQKDKLTGKLIEKERLYRDRIDLLEERMTKKGRDIGVLARKKPVLVEKIIDRAAEHRIRCLEIASGDPVTEDDRNAKNTLCPKLISPDPKP